MDSLSFERAYELRRGAARAKRLIFAGDLNEVHGAGVVSLDVTPTTKRALRELLRERGLRAEWHATFPNVVYIYPGR